MLEQNGLAGAAGADDGRDLASREIERDAVEHLLLAEALAQLAHFDRIAGGGGRLARLRTGFGMVDFSLAHDSSNQVDTRYHKSIDVRK